MKTPLLLSLLSATALAVAELESNVSNVESSPSEVEPSPKPESLCDVRAWVRAEDLSPDHTSHGELRIKVPRPECAHQIASVALRLHLEEFGEFKYVKKGMVLPVVELSENQTTPHGYDDWAGVNGLYNYQQRDNAMSDPEFWTVKAEQRRAWMAEATLLDNNPDASQPIVTPFTVVVPAVNYPPAVTRYRSLDSTAPVSRHAWSDLAYRYVAVVTFTDGRTVDIHAGHTTFVPASPASASKMPFTWNTTFGQGPDCAQDSPTRNERVEQLKKCLPEAQRSEFIAEITLEEGNAVQKGRPLKGRVTVHGTSGSTTMTDISISLKTIHRNHWAQAQAAAGGDVDFYNATSPFCSWGSDKALDPESSNYLTVFDEKDDNWKARTALLYSSTAASSLTPAHPFFDFELQVPQEIPTNFESYYTNGENLLQLSLTVLYSQEVAHCITPQPRYPLFPDGDEPTVDDDAKTEEGLWDSYTPVGKQVQDQNIWHRTMKLQATVPITVVSGEAPARSVAHYLTPGVPAPVIRRGGQADVLEFPVVQPVFTVESQANTSARLMQPGSSDPYIRQQQFMNMSLYSERSSYPDPTREYRGGNYAGLLWRKKVVAEKRGVLPLRSEVVEGENTQKPLAM